jgi:nucleotide-binding universal stress UspA family protein
MNMKKRVLFGVDDSVFARQAIAGVGGLLRHSADVKITIFHGAPDPEFSLFSRVPRLNPEFMGNYQKLWSLEQLQVLERAKEVLTEIGFDPDRVETIYEEKCNDPASSIYKLASLEDFETIALARWGASAPAQKLMGGVTYQLANLADDRVLWLVDPRILSHDVLVTVVGADISRRVMEHAVRYFSHLTESRFTIFHVIPPVPPQVYQSSYWIYEPPLNEEEGQDNITLWMKEYANKAKEITDEGKEKLIKAGIPEQNVTVKFQAQNEGIARDILAELEEGTYGVLLLGRKGFKDISQFGLGSKANKLLHAARAFVTCLVN